jgi:hypothetical protein
MKKQETFVVFYKDKQEWHISQEFKGTKKALDFMDEMRKQGLIAYTAHLETIIEHLPDLVFLEVENQERGQ